MKGSKGEVMWPRLVVNKFFRKGFGSNNFVADIPNNKDVLLHSPNIYLGRNSLSDASLINNHKHIHNYKVFVSTWNVGGIAPKEHLNMEDWLDATSDMCDIYVLGFQEIVPLRASNVLGSDKSKISMKWNSMIREALNKRSKASIKSENSIAQGNNFINITPQEFKCLISKQMVGILNSVWVRGDLLPYVRHPSVSCVGCGIMGCLGNKGSVAVRFQLHETSFCFVCTHLTSGGREGDEKHRNADVAEIFSRSYFPRGPSLDLPRKILDHDRLILLGDLNYRISLPQQETRFLVDIKEWDALLRHDQLSMEFMDGQAFEGWHEGSIQFAPTYKYCPNSGTYYGCVKGNKWRAPAWCDRIIWYGEGLEQQSYTRGESDLSDHRPVKAIFSAKVKGLGTLKRMQGLFSSERFDHEKIPRNNGNNNNFPSSPYKFWLTGPSFGICSYEP